MPVDVPWRLGSGVPPARLRRRLAVSLTVAAAFVAVGASSVRAADGQPLLDRVASTFAMRTATIQCHERADDPNLSDAWGYTSVFLDWDWAVLDNDLCQALADELGVTVAPIAYVPPKATGPLEKLSRRAIGDPPASDWGGDWTIATALLVLTHESFHVRHWNLNASESAVECRAVRHAAYAGAMLGVAGDRLAALRPWWLAVHWRIGVLAPAYASPKCVVPWPW